MAKPSSGSILGNEVDRRKSDFQLPPLWKSYLYQLQQQAPTPHKVVCTREILNRPPFYGKEFHGMISREQTDIYLQDREGAYLVRESHRAPGTFTLCMRFGGVTKNFKLYYDGQHFVGEKRFYSIHDLVADGLISLYLEVKAGDYIAIMCNESNYELSPYMTLNSRRRKRNRPDDRQHPSSPDFYERPPDDVVTKTEEILAAAFERNSINVQNYEKPHMFKIHNFKGLHWCDFCGNFMWGLIGQGVKCEDCGFGAHRKCSENVPNDCCPDLKHVRRVFGVDLTTLVKAHNTVRPFVVDMCIKEIEVRGLGAEGLYRVSGFNDDIEAVRLSIDKDGENANISRTAYEDINVITGVLKLYFRLLPIPLITFDAHPLFIAAVRKPIQEEKLPALKEAIMTLPPAHYQTLKYLMSHLHRVAERSKDNLMPTHNLSTVFCPTLMRSPDIGTPDLSVWKYESTAIELLITHQKILFD